MAFAEGTTVPVAKTRGEIEALVEKYGAKSFGSGWLKDDRAAITFAARGRVVRFELPLPNKDDAKKALEKKRNYWPTQAQLDDWLAKEQRRRWRCLLLAIKAKLEVVESGIASFEEEFLANIVTSDNRTLYEALKMAEGGQRLLPPVEGA